MNAYTAAQKFDAGPPIISNRNSPATKGKVQSIENNRSFEAAIEKKTAGDFVRRFYRCNFWIVLDRKSVV